MAAQWRWTSPQANHPSAMSEQEQTLGEPRSFGSPGASTGAGIGCSPCSCGKKRHYSWTKKCAECVAGNRCRKKSGVVSFSAASLLP